MIPCRTTFKFEYLREFENVLGYELGAHMGLIDEKNQGPKISCYCTFKSNLYLWKGLPEKLFNLFLKHPIKLREILCTDPTLDVVKNRIGGK